MYYVGTYAVRSRYWWRSNNTVYQFALRMNVYLPQNVRHQTIGVFLLKISLALYGTINYWPSKCMFCTYQVRYQPEKIHKHTVEHRAGKAARLASLRKMTQLGEF
jgi:hypothetical protein